MDTNTAQPTATMLRVQSRNAYPQQQVPGTPTVSSINGNTHKIIFSAPASPASNMNDNSTASSTAPPSGGISRTSVHRSGSHQSTPLPSTPKKQQLDARMLRKIRELLLSPGGCNLQSLSLEVEPVNVIKDRYLISSMPNPISAVAVAKTPVSYRHLIDLSSAHLKCTDVFTEEHFLCKIINEPLHKVQMAYFQLQQDSEGCRSELYRHNLIRAVRDIVPMCKDRTYVIIPSAVGGAHLAPNAECIYEDLHTYIRNKKRLTEDEARGLFHQICQTVHVCHRNGIVLRDLKLKRFYFIDSARTKLQYESLEGSMILDDPCNDTLTDKIGCPLYTAPELLCPNPTYNGKPADMWSLGVILYTMLVGQYPFYEKGNCSLIRVIRHGHVQIPGNLSKSVRWLLLSLLRKNYVERLRAEYIFLSPWLRKQQTLYVPADIVIPDDIEESDADSSEPLDYSCTKKLQQFQYLSNEPYNSGDVEMG